MAGTGHDPATLGFGVPRQQSSFHSALASLLCWHFPGAFNWRAEDGGGACDEASRGVDGACAGSFKTSSGEELEDDLDIFVIVPHLEDRELGEPNLDDEGEVVIWDHPLPFFGQAVTELGFELPLPFGISIVPATFEQDLTLRRSQIRTAGRGGSPH